MSTVLWVGDFSHYAVADLAPTLQCLWAHVGMGRLSAPTHSKSLQNFLNKTKYSSSQPKCLNLNNFALISCSLLFFYPQWAEVMLPPSVTDADPGGNVIGKSAPTQATGPPACSRARKIAVPVVNTTINDPPTLAPSCPSQAKKNNSKAVKKILPSESDPNLSTPMVDINRIIVMEDGNEPLVNAEPSQSLGCSRDAALGPTQHNYPRQMAAPKANINQMMDLEAINSNLGMGEKVAASETEANLAVVKLTQTKSYCTYGLKQVVLNVADPDATPTQDLISHGNRQCGGQGIVWVDWLWPTISVQAMLINDSSGVLPSSPISGPTQAVSHLHGLYMLRHRLDVPSLTLIDPMLRYHEPKTPDPTSSNEDFNSTMLEDDTPPNSEHVRKTWATNPDHHNLAAVRHVDGTFSQQSLLANDSMSPG
ncbi:uncharacterized protein LACBIDRAFT_335809 [Laccaria bicolor S238N-H82]|uniref:Predicted protein n=1 Tax=Laccaria bicolor (strain S238N-H82 / ATCC MYA-4686) TaxID=486041 RepID=B0E3H0_LACBS|nr:uncharacterized protein LACBIDRAFT_335809 [Laccaria bicolor S238N-H82]EDQ98611.1 predicted protein [Laccaria bicolor S238N-H82]|eukprot:XP_001890738.1 predicted protein [Laccaria bicolor S238N-H82]